MIVVTGATGALGRLVLASLIDGDVATDTVGLVRDPAKAADLGVPVRVGSYDDPASLRAQIDRAAVSRHERDRRHPHTGQVVRRAIVDRHGQS